MSIEIQIEQKESMGDEFSRKVMLSYGSEIDFQLAKNLSAQIMDPERRKELNSYLEERKKGRQGKNPITFGDLSSTDFSKEVTEKGKREFMLAQDALNLADSGEFIGAIENVANLESKLIKAHTFGALAAKVDGAGFDATPVLVLAVDNIRDYMSDPGIDSIDALSGIELTEEILPMAADLGYYNVVRLSVQRTQDQIILRGMEYINPEFLFSVATLLIYSAGLQKEGGMNEREIRNFNSSDIERFSSLNNDFLKQALSYFGLIK